MYRQKFKNSSLTARAFVILTNLVAGSLAVTVETIAVAKPPAPKPPAVSPAVAPTYSSNFNGTVERYLLNPEGILDGLLLSNGLQVKFPPHMADSLNAAVKPGDRVQVAGKPGVPTNFGQEIRAYSITNTKTENTIVDQPPRYKSQPPVGSRFENLSAEGTAIALASWA